MLLEIFKAELPEAVPRGSLFRPSGKHMKTKIQILAAHRVVSDLATY